MSADMLIGLFVAMVVGFILSAFHLVINTQLLDKKIDDKTEELKAIIQSKND